MYQERLGWERPGWFALGSKPRLNEYDYYGAYENKRNISEYEDLLTKDLTFDFPEHHDIVREIPRHLYWIALPLDGS